MADQARVLGIPFSLLSLKDTANLVSSWLDAQDREQTQPHFLVTANPEMIMYANSKGREHAELRDSLLYADMVTPDGIGIVMALRMKGYPIQDRVTGADLTPLLLKHCDSKGYRVFLLGASAANNQKAVEYLTQAYPGAEFAGRDGYFKEQDLPSVLEEIKQFQPHLLLVGLGMARQEIFICRYRDYLKVPVSIGIGGVIDIFSGAVKRAPEIWIKLRLEWLYRLLKQPSRFKRQLVLPQFAWIVFKERLAGKSTP